MIIFIFIQWNTFLMHMTFYFNIHLLNMSLWWREILQKRAYTINGRWLPKSVQGLRSCTRRRWIRSVTGERRGYVPQPRYFERRRLHPARSRRRICTRLIRRGSGGCPIERSWWWSWKIPTWGSNEIRREVMCWCKRRLTSPWKKKLSYGRK